MKISDPTEIKELILTLHQNDTQEIYSGAVEPQEPIRTMNRLIDIGHEAVPYLIKELREYKKRIEDRYYPKYVIKILGEIGDASSLEDLANMANDKFESLDIDVTIKAIAKMGQDVVPFYLQRIDNTKSEKEIQTALWVFQEMSEKNEDVLEFAINILKQHKDFDIKLYAIDVIGTHGSQKDIKILERYLSSKDDEEQNIAKEAVQNLLNENKAKLRDILTKYKIIGHERCERFGRDTNNAFNMLGIRYSQKEKFEGNNASELNEAVKEYFSRKVMIDLLYQTQSFGVDEGLLSENNKEKILDVWRELHRKQEEHVKQYQDAISVLNSYDIKANVQSKETHSFKKMYPISEKLLQKTKKWFETQGFETSTVAYDIFDVSYYILARKNSKKGCIVHLYKTSQKRIWADIRLEIIGEDWASEEIKNMQTTFWNQFSDIAERV